MTAGFDVSVIVTTRNNELTLEDCLSSIRGQQGVSVQLIVIDNGSTDATVAIAEAIADVVADRGPERSAQRNHGASLASADWLFFIDSDMVLPPRVVADALAAAKTADAEVVVVGEESFGEGFWARCKALERSFYLGVDWIEAPRFFSRRIFDSVKGYDENLTGPEDFDLPQRMRHADPGIRSARAASLIRHNEQRLSLRRTLSKKRYYGRTMDTYATAPANVGQARRQANPLSRYALFLASPRELFAEPGVGLGMLFLKTAEFAAGALGYAERTRGGPPHTAVLVSHSTGLAGPIDYYAEFLDRQGSAVTLIAHPLDTYSGAHSTVTVDGTAVWSRTRQRGGPPALLFDALVSLRWIINTPGSSYVGANNFDTVCCLVGRALMLRRNSKVIYFASDFSETRFASPVMDRFYRAAEKIALTRSDVVVSNTHRAAGKRAELGLAPERSVVVPNGVVRRDVVARQPQPGHFVYVGSVTREHGLFEMLTALRPIVKKLLLIGDGDDWDRVVLLTETLGAEVEIHRAEDRAFVLEQLSRFSGFGLAPYNTEARWTYYCSPLKVVEYLACGLPVIISEVPEIAGEIAERGLGITYGEIDGERLCSALGTFDTSGFSSRAAVFAADYDSDRLYQRIVA